MATTATSSSSIRPFEWLTSPVSLAELVQEYILGRRREDAQTTSADDCETVTDDLSSNTTAASTLQALHVGCGSSTVGEFLVQESGFGKVVNVDRDAEIMVQMKERWRDICSGTTSLSPSKMEFLTLDFTKEQLPEQYNTTFDLVLDKSTLDCTLCSDIATASLLLEVYRTLRDNGGVYLVISFHELDLLLPLLRDLPGAQWTVEHTTMERKVEQLGVGAKSTSSSTTNCAAVPEDDLPNSTATERKPLNVLVCRRYTDATQGNTTETSHNLDFEAACEHIHRVNDQWFQEQQPLLTEERMQDLEHAFGYNAACLDETKEGNITKLLSLDQAFNVLFTEEEREHLTFEHFLEDWEAFHETRKPSANSKAMSFETAIEFLKEMQ